MRVLRLPEVVERVGLSKSSVWRLIQQGEFPRPIRLGGRAVGWRDDEIEYWIESRDRVNWWANSSGHGHKTRKPQADSHDPM